MTSPQSEPVSTEQQPAPTNDSGGTAQPTGGDSIGSVSNSVEDSAGVSGATSAPGTIEETALVRLRTALATEHAAIWAYGLISAYSPKDATLINSNRNGHIFRRDAAADRVLAAGGKAVQPRAAYHLPHQVTDVDSARKLARLAEDDCARAWLRVMGVTSNADLRQFALSSLSDSAVRLAMLRKLSKMRPYTKPFPGRD